MRLKHTFVVMNRFKYFLLIFLFFFLKNSLISQEMTAINLPKYDQMPLHFGMALGFNTMDFTIRNSALFNTPLCDSIYSIENTPRPGFNINVISTFQFKPLFAIRFLPGLNFGQRDLQYWVKKDSTYYPHTMILESTYLDFPILFQYKANRLNNFRPYLIGGGSFKIDLAAQKKILPQERPKIRLNRLSYYYEVGFGTDFMLEYFKFALELKYVVGINNVLKYDSSQYTTAIGKMTSKMIIFSFLFEGSDLRSFKKFKLRK